MLMPNEEMVAVPVRLLKKLEESRVELYNQFDHNNFLKRNTASFSIIEMMDKTEVMWELAHRKWEKVLTSEPNNV